MTNRLRISLLALLAVAASAGSVRADWLVTKDGGRIETKGPWKVDGRRIVFTLPTGTLSSVRTDEIDLDQSAAVTAQVAEAVQAAASPKPEARKEPVMRLTEKDIPPVSDTGEEEEAGSGAAGAKGEAAGSPLEVTTWDKTSTGDGENVEIFGTVRNNSKANITSPSVMVMIYGPDGGLLATNEATVNAGMIAPGQTANFRVAFPGVPDFTAAKFDAQGRGFRTNPEAASEEGGEAPGGETPADQAPPAEEAPPPSV